jgi:hypothetical protein
VSMTVRLGRSAPPSGLPPPLRELPRACFEPSMVPFIYL